LGKVKLALKRSIFETKKWLYHNVVTTMHCKEICNLAVELSGSPPGSQPFLHGYKRAHSQVEEKLTKRERQKYRIMAKKWSEKKLPPRMQQQYVHGKF